MDKYLKDIEKGQCYLGIELGSTIIKSVLISSDYKIIESGSYFWENKFVDNLWTYDYEDIITGLRLSYNDLSDKIYKKYGTYIIKLVSIGVSGMMHGIIPLDKNNKPLAPFLTWRNTNTRDASSILSKELQFNIPLRWTISQLYQAHLENKDYLKEVAYITTLAGYIHYLLTENKVIGIDDASGMFPIDSSTL